MSNLATTLAAKNTFAPLTEAEELMLDTPFTEWPIRASFTDGACICCGHIECVND